MNPSSSSKDPKNAEKRHLSLTQVKRMKSQTETEKKDLKDSITNSPITPCKTCPDLENTDLRLTEKKTHEKGIAKEKQPFDSASTPAKIVRKDSRSLTAINSPIDKSPSNSFIGQPQKPIRRLLRTKTQLPKLKNGQINKSVSPLLRTLKVKDPESSPLIKKDTKNPFLVENSSQFLDKEVEKNTKNHFAVPNSPQLLDKEIEKVTSKNAEKSFFSSFKNGNRFSVNSNGSNGSLYFGEAQFELLADLTKSVRELNQRLIRSEEVTIERLKENLELKNKIKTLETRIDEQKNHKLETDGVQSGCSSRCFII